MIRKKILSSLILFICFGCFLFAEINPPKRYFEVGVNANVGIANSFLSINDILQETVVLDFNKMADTIDSKKGFVFGLNSNVDAWVGFYFGKVFRLTFFTGVDVEADAGLPYNLIDLLANGNEIDVPMEGSFAIEGDAVAKVGVEIGSSLKLFGKRVLFSVTPSVFSPVVHMSGSVVDYSSMLSSDGSIQFDATVNANLYSAVKLDDLQINLAQLFNNAGMDFSIYAEVPLFSWLDVGMTLGNIPIKNASIAYKNTYVGTISSHIDDVTSLPSDLYEIDIPENQPTVTEANEKIQRKFLIGFAAAYRPISNKIIAISLKPELLFKISSSNILTVGKNISGCVDATLLTEATLLNIFNFGYETGYRSGEWKQKALIGINVRVVDLTVGIASVGKTFAGSFAGNGLSLDLGLKVGF